MDRAEQSENTEHVVPEVIEILTCEEHGLLVIHTLLEVATESNASHGPFAFQYVRSLVSAEKLVRAGSLLSIFSISMGPF